MSLYTLYRPRDWDSVIGQDLISTILRNSLRQGRVGHAYIFTGTRGTGKTTSARILAKGVNCENLQDGNPCHTCENCKAFDNNSMLDIIEIDAASNTGVDNIRDLIDKARYKPTQGKWKVYIIDEVHMLSGGAFNALLKTLEEPPPHVKFILATTEIEKVPETIRSRSLRFDFRKITEADIVKRLQFVTKEESIKIDDEALHIIAKAARGAMRDALTLLEQNTINGEVSTEYVRSTLALLEESLIDEIITNIYEGNLERILDILEVLRERHVQVRGFFDQILYALRDKLFASLEVPLVKGGAGDFISDFSIYESIFTVFESAYTKIKGIPDGMMLIEITLLRAVKGREVGIMKTEGGSKSGSVLPPEKGETKGVRQNKGSSHVTHPNLPFSGKEGEIKTLDSSLHSEGRRQDSETSSEGPQPAPEQVPQEQIHHSPEGQKQTETKKTKQDVSTEFTLSGAEGVNMTETKNSEPSTEYQVPSTKPPFSYATLLRDLKEKKPALMADLKMARYELRDTTLLLIFSKEWNYTRVNTAPVKNLITESLEGQFSGNWNVECFLDTGTTKDITDGVF